MAEKQVQPVGRKEEPEEEQTMNQGSEQDGPFEVSIHSSDRQRSGQARNVASVSIHNRLAYMISFDTDQDLSSIERSVVESEIEKRLDERWRSHCDQLLAHVLGYDDQSFDPDLEEQLEASTPSIVQDIRNVRRPKERPILGMFGSDIGTP